MISKRTTQRLWIAHLLHRLSGLGLAIFLPLHFLLLGLALNDRGAMDEALSLSAHPLFKIAEFGLVFLLAVHLFGGIRLLVLEWVKPVSERWNDAHKTLAAIAIALAFAVSMLFLMQVI